MPLFTDADTKTQTFRPDLQGLIPDIMGMTRPPTTAPTVRALGQPEFYVEHMDKVMPGLSYWRATIYEGRGGSRQQGRFDRDHASPAVIGHAFDDQGIGRNFFATDTQGTPDPNTPLRSIYANFNGKMHAGFYDPGHEALYAETSTTDPTIAAVGAYAAPVGTAGMLCMRAFTANGASYLGVGYATTATTAFQALSTAYASTLISASFAAPNVYDFVQTAGVNGDALIVNAGGGLWSSSSTVSTLPAALTFTFTGTAFAQGGYCIGIVTLGGGTPYIAWAVPFEGGVAHFAAGQTFRLKVVLTDLEGKNPSELKFPLPYVTYASAMPYPGGVFACDGVNHWYHTGNARIAVDKQGDHAANSNSQRVCRSHWIKGDKVFWEINETKTTSGTGSTVRYVMEYDVYLNTSRQVSARQTLSTTGLLSIAGPGLPVSDSTDYLHVYSDGSWRRQYQPPTGILGFGQRKTAGSADGTGRAFENQGVSSWAPMEIPGLEGHIKWLSVLTGPPPANIAAGGTGATVTLAELSSGISCTFDAEGYQNGGYDDRAPYAMIPQEDAGGFYLFEPSITSVAQSGGTDPTHYTSNIFPAIYEGFAYREPMRVPSGAAKRKAAG